MHPVFLLYVSKWKGYLSKIVMRRKRAKTFILSVVDMHIISFMKRKCVDTFPMTPENILMKVLKMFLLMVWVFSVIYIKEWNITSFFQSLLRLKEPAVLLRCRKDDHHLVESVLESAKEEYAQKLQVHPPEIIVDHQIYLPPGPGHHNAHGPSW